MLENRVGHLFGIFRWRRFLDSRNELRISVGCLVVNGVVNLGFTEVEKLLLQLVLLPHRTELGVVDSLHGITLVSVKLLFVNLCIILEAVLLIMT